MLEKISVAKSLPHGQTNLPYSKSGFPRFGTKLVCRADRVDD